RGFHVTGVQTCALPIFSTKEFYNTYYKKQKPVVIENLTHDWPAYQKWKLSYIKEIAGEKTVPLYDDRPVSDKDKFNEAHAEMKKIGRASCRERVRKRRT